MTTSTSPTRRGDGERVLDGFTATIEPGESVAIVGATGSGKSTLARLIPRFYDVGEGAVRVDGHDVRTLDLHDLRSAVATVTDDPFLFATSIHDNVTFAQPDAPEHDVRAALDDAAAGEFVAELGDGVETEVGERGLTLSGGQRQRIAIARTLLADPCVLILDDATSAIDVAVEERIHQALAARRSDRTTILIAHRLSTIALADRVILLADGRVAATGTHDELLVSNPRYAAILADGTAESAEGENLMFSMGGGGGRADGWAVVDGRRTLRPVSLRRTCRVSCGDVSKTSSTTSPNMTSPTSVGGSTIGIATRSRSSGSSGLTGGGCSPLSRSS